MWQRLGLGLIAIFIILTSTQPVDAHGYIVRATPEDRAVLERAPRQVQIWFSEGLAPEISTIRVVNAAGEAVDLGDGRVDDRNPAKMVVSLPTGLPDGVYLVKVRSVFTSDGHGVNTTLVFWIGEPTEAANIATSSDRAAPLEALWRAILTVALATILGVYALYLGVLRPSWGNPRWRWGALPPRIMHRLNNLLWVALIAACIANGFALLQITAELLQTDLKSVMEQDLWRVTLAGTNFGDMWVYRMGILGLMLALHIIASQQARNRPQTTHFLWQTNTGFAVLAILTMSFISHAAGAEIWRELSVLVDFLHLMGVSLWVGGLIVLAFVLRPALTPLNPIERGIALTALIRRFSQLAMVALSLIITTGFYNSLVAIPAPSDLTTSTYGLTMLSKWILMLPLVGLGAIHQVVVHPQRWQAYIPDWQIPDGLARLPQTLRLETLFALLVMFAAGWLPATPPPIPATPPPALPAPTQTQNIAGYEVTLTISPSAIGANTLDLKVTQAGEAVPLRMARIRFSDPAYARYTAPLTLEELEAGLWGGASGDINYGATWWAYVDFEPIGTDPLRAAFRWEFQAEIPDLAGRTPTLANFLAILLVGGVVAGWSLPLLKITIQHHWSAENLITAGAIIGITLIILIGGTFSIRSTSQQVREERRTPPDRPNPIVADQNSMDIGGAIYQTECMVCHGVNGRGQTSLSLNLNRPTPNLTLLTRRDEDLFRILTSGIVTRHNYATTLGEEERWHLINFLRSLESD